MAVDYSSNSKRLRPTVKNLLLMTVILAGASILFAACGDSSPSVVGDWQAISADGTRGEGTLFHRRSTVEFFEDGTLDISGESADWTWVAGDFFWVETADEAYALEITVGDTLGDERLTVRDRGYGGDAVVTFSRKLSRRFKQISSEPIN